MRNINVILILSFLLFTIIGCNNSTLNFNHDKWINAKENGSWDVRKKMAQDLISNKALNGKSKEEIFNLLGMPEDYSDVKSNELYYTIELKYDTDIDPIKVEYLIVSLDSKERVINVYRKIALDK